MNSSRFKKFGGLLAVLALLIIACSMAAPAYADDGTVVSIPDANATYCNTTTVAISITNVTQLGAATIRLHYNASVVHVTSVVEGNLGGTFLSTIDNATGITNMTWFTTAPGGVNGTFTFANVTLHAVGSAGETSPLNLEVVTLADASGNPISYTEDDGIFTIPGAPVTADAGGPYTGTAGSSVSLSGSATGGTPPYTYAWDLDNDGAYDDSTAQNPSYTWATVGDYTVGLKVTDSRTDTDTDTASVHITTATPPTGVGGTAYPPNKVMILAPWIALAAAIIAGATIFLRRRRAQG